MEGDMTAIELIDLYTALLEVQNQLQQQHKSCSKLNFVISKFKKEIGQ
jgi:hypothetical protein